jgi:hypothetical protein
MKHTDGPWFWEKRDNRIKLVSPPHGYCTVMDFTRMGMQGGQPRFSDRNGEPRGGVMVNADQLDLSANPDACLIAAAPQLYEELKHAVETLEGIMGATDVDSESDLSTSSFHVINRWAGARINEARAALEKAEAVG